VSDAAAWFSALGEPLGEAERAEIDAYLEDLGLRCPIRTVASWRAAFEVSNRPAADWWAAEEAERSRLEKRVRHARPRSIRSCASTPYTAADAGRSASMKADSRSSDERR
jgi:hypothetical protein